MIREALEAAGDRQVARIASLAHRRRLLEVALLSGLGLFVELLLIRWLDAYVRPLAYVKNLSLIASFLGLGIGFALAESGAPLVRQPHRLLGPGTPYGDRSVRGPGACSPSELRDERDEHSAVAEWNG